MSNIVIENVGPIEYVEIPYPEEGGLVILEGGHALGKTTALKAISSVLTGKGSLDKRDGALSGGIEAFGVKVTIGKNTRRAGSMACYSIESKLPIGALIDPGIDDPAAADRARIKALMVLVGAGNDPAIFHKLLGGEKEFKAVVGEVTGTDGLDLAKKIKAAIQAKALDAERAAERATGEATANETAAQACGPDWISDPAKLAKDLELAIAEEARIKAVAKAAKETREKAVAAAEQLAKAGTDAAVKLAEAEGEAKESHVVWERCHKDVQRLEKELQTAKLALAKAASDLTADEKALEAAKNHADTVAGWQETVNAAAEVETPTDDDLCHAEEYVESRRNAITMHERASLAAQAKTKADAAKVEAANQTATGERLRKAASEIDGVLSGLVATLDSPIKIKDCRMVVNTKRGEEFYGDLSGGNRVLTAIRVVAPHIPAGSPLHIPQENLQELNTDSQLDVHRLCRELKIVAVSALPTNGKKLTARVFGSAPLGEGDVSAEVLDEVGKELAR